MYCARMILSMLLLLGLALAGCQPIQPEAAMDGAPPKQARQIQGELYLPGVPEWGGVAVALDFDLQETNTLTHEAEGGVNWRNFTPEPFDGKQWKVVHADATQVFYGEDVPGGDPNSAVIVAQIREREGWGQGEPGEYAWFWLRDGGSDAPDEWAMRYYSFDPWYEFYPSDGPPSGYFTLAEAQADDPAFPLVAEGGDLTVGQAAQ